MADKAKPRQALLLRRLDRVIERLTNQQGKVAFEADLALLRKYLRQATVMNSWLAIGRTWNTLGLLYKLHGQLQKALDAFQVAIDTAESYGYLRGQIVGWLNQSSVYGEFGEYHRVVEVCNRVSPLLESIEIDPIDKLNIRLRVYCNLADANTLLQQYDFAEQQTDMFLYLWQDPSITQIEQPGLALMMGTMRADRAAIFIAREQFDKAISESDMILELGARLQSPVNTVTGYLLKLIVTLRSPSFDLPPPEMYWSQAEKHTQQLIAEQKDIIWRVAHQAYLYGATLFANFGLHTWAIRAARKAADLLTMLGETADTTAVTALLDKLVSADKRDADDAQL